MVLHIVKVNLNDPNIDLAVTPRSILGTDTTTFLNNVGASVAINGGGYTESNGEFDPGGFSASQEDIYSNEAPGMTLFVSEENDVTFFDRPSAVWDAVTGFTLLVRDGNIYSGLTNCDPSICPGDCGSRGYCTIRSRTTIGHTEADNTFIIVVVEGDGSSSTQGASILDLANIMDRCGADNAVNMDGGGSSTLSAREPNSVGRYNLNRRFAERVVANHLAICIGECTIPSDPSIIPNNIAPPETALPRYAPGSEYPFPCNLTAPENSYYQDDEFHSLRPYQASPCNPNKEDLALFCGNDLFVGDPVSIVKNFNNGTSETYSYNGAPIIGNGDFDPYGANACLFCSSDLPGMCERSQDPNCIPYVMQCSSEGITDECGHCDERSDGTEICSFTFSNSKEVAVDLSNAELPIMGYTEPSLDNQNDPDPKVINSVNTEEETMDHATKINEYVSWYLNGVTGRAEYPYNNPKLDCIGESTGKVGSCMETRYGNGGELQCLGTWGIPFIESFPQPLTIADGKSVCSGETNYCCVSSVLPTFVEQTPGSSYIVNYSGPLKKLLPFSIQNIERSEEVERGYNSDHEDSLFDTGDQIRHSQVVGCDFGDTFSVFNFTTVTIGGIISKCYGDTFFGRVLDWLHVDGALEHQRLTDFHGNTPPIEEDYLEDPLLWLFGRWVHDYKEWRGNTCVSLPINIPLVGVHVFDICLNNPLSSNVFGNLFSYIPMSSTEDRVGDVKIKSARVGTRSYSPNLRIISTRISDVQNADLYFPHMEESVDLADLLQKTFAYKDADRDNIDNSGFVPASPYCEYRQVRSNPGDDLFAGELSADVEYTAQVRCTYFNWGGVNGAPAGNLCTNLISGGSCASNMSSCGTYYGQYDCADGEFCCSGTGQPAGSYNCATGSNTSRCVPENWLCVVATNLDFPCPNGYKCALFADECALPLTQPPQTQTCSNEVLVNLRLETRTPLANKVWAKLVAGSSGVFRKMFPHIGSGDDFEGIIDMPTSSRVSYSLRSGSSGSLYAGNPSGQISGSNAQLYFPHIGGIKEYFLTGIQTLLRPKGMGEQPEFCEGDACLQANGGANDTYSCSILDQQLSSINVSGQCGICNSPPLGQLAQSILTAAGEAYNVPAAAIYATMLHEGATWSEYDGQFTDENVCTWSAPVTRNQIGNMPRCDNTNPETQAPFGWMEYWFYNGNEEEIPWSAIQSFDPSKNSPDLVSRCNFLDAAFATAKSLHFGVSHIPLAAQTLSSCNGYPETPVAPSTSCNWDNQMMFLATQMYAGYCPESEATSGDYPAIPSLIPNTIDYFNLYRCY